MIEKVRWKVKGLFKADPEEVYKELQTLEEVTPDSIVELAKSESSVLHDLFDWDDKVAADKWRKQQGRIIQCNLIVEQRETEDSEPTFIRLYHKLDDSDRYEDIHEIVVHEERYMSLLETAKRDLNSFQLKYHSLKELKPVFDAINEI